MATQEYDYFYQFNLVKGKWVLASDLSGVGDGDGQFELSETNGDGLFAHYTNGQPGPGGDTSQEPLTGENNVTYYYRGVINLGTQGDPLFYPVFSTAAIGSGTAVTSYYVGMNTAWPLDRKGDPIDMPDIWDTGITSPACYYAGTLIDTPAGERPVEQLRPGDLVNTANGPQPVKFVACTTRDLASLRAEGRMPIRISAAAFGVRGPSQDLWLSPAHALLLEGYLVEAGALLNGTTISQPEDVGGFTVTYYNIELEQHAILRANGLEIESYFANWRSNGFSRESWDNYAEYLELYGESLPMQELDLPRIPFARQLPAEIRLLLQLQEQPSSVAL